MAKVVAHPRSTSPYYWALLSTRVILLRHLQFICLKPFSASNLLIQGEKPSPYIGIPKSPTWARPFYVSDFISYLSPTLSCPATTVGLLAFSKMFCVILKQGSIRLISSPLAPLCLNVISSRRATLTPPLSISILMYIAISISIPISVYLNISISNSLYWSIIGNQKPVSI